MVLMTVAFCGGWAQLRLCGMSELLEHADELLLRCSQGGKVRMARLLVADVKSNPGTYD
jgi:hypothetical protein